MSTALPQPEASRAESGDIIGLFIPSVALEVPEKQGTQHPRQPSLNLQARVFYMVSSISALLPGIAGSSVYFKIKKYNG